VQKSKEKRNEMRRLLSALTLFALTFVGVRALYADQAGKWDWCVFSSVAFLLDRFPLRRQQFVGAVDNALFDASGAKVFVSTNDGVVAALNTRTGDIGTSFTSTFNTCLV
jgi:hypothetical protein